ncbi:MAG: hypothetical protein J6W38_02530 [Prevotella sp.]|nr:hypothetical protein [Prevotella sp.]
MNKKLLFSMLLLFVGVSMQAQSVAAEQMDERFNDGTKMPYGWFAEGWKVSDGKAKAEATDGSSGFDFSQMMNMNPGENPGSTGTPNMMGGMFGGPRYRTYLLTPPVVVKADEELVFSASKPSGDDNGMGFSFDMKAIMGMTDTIFVVERSVYGRNQWVRVGDYTTVLNNEFQKFTISNTPAGEYRFRFISYVNAEIDSVAGFHIDNEAPDLLVTVDSLHTRFVDYSVCAKDSTKEFIVINTGTGTLKVNIESRDPELFSIDQSKLSIAAGDSAKLNVTFHYGNGKIGKNETSISFIPEDTRVYGTSINVAALITDPEVWATDFNDNQLPLGCYGEGFVVKEGVATHYNPAGGGMAAMAAIFGGGGASDWFMTPPLTIQNENDAVIFSLKNGDGSYKGPIIDAQAAVTIEKSVYGSNVWEKVDAYELKDTLYHTKWISWFPAGDYRFRFVSGDSLCIDSIAGGRINMNAPDLLVRHNGRAVQTVNYGIARGNTTKTFQLINTGTSALQLYAMSSDPTFYTLSQQMFEIAPGESANIDVTFNFNAEALGAHQAALVLTPTNCQIAMQMIYLSAYITYENAWSEDFEPEFVVEEGETVDLPAEWSTTGWQIIKGGGMDMSAMMGMGGGEKTWAPHADSDAYELTTPYLQAKQGDVLRFYADISSGWLNLFYRFSNGPEDNNSEWTYQNTYITADSIYFIAPVSGIYQLKFTGSSVAVDDFVGFLEPMEYAILKDDAQEETNNAEVIAHFKGQKVNVYYDRVLSAVNNGYGSWTPKAYTLCLPYEFRFSELVEPGKIKFYQLSFIDDYYKQFIFTAVTDAAEAGKAYLAVVEQGDVSLNAYNVELTAEAINDSESTAVNDYGDWFFNDNLTKVGQWVGNFSSISATEADSKNMFCLLDDGTWVRFTSTDNADAKLNAFRAYYLADAPAEARSQAPVDMTAKVFRTLFSNVGVGSVSDGNVPDAFNILYNADIPTPSSVPTGILPTIQTIEADGTSRYFDLQGRMLNGKPNKGVYLENGKKFIAK